MLESVYYLPESDEIVTVTSEDIEIYTTRNMEEIIFNLKKLLIEQNAVLLGYL